MGKINQGIDFIELAFWDVADLEVALADILNKNPDFGVHVPFVLPPGKDRAINSLSLVSDDYTIRESALAEIALSLKYASVYKASYLVCHMTGDGSDANSWAKYWAKKSAESLAELSLEYAIPINIEYLGYNPTFMEPEDYTDLISNYPQLGICLDSGHLHILSKVKQRDWQDLLEPLLPKVRSLHLWNTNVFSFDGRRRHEPIHPSQSSEAGWMDIQELLQIVASGVKINRLPIIFEDTVGISDQDFVTAGREWASNIWRRVNAKKSF